MSFKSCFIIMLGFVLCLPAQAGVTGAERTRMEARAAKVDILRDKWGIPHIYGPTDADVVFGTVYAQAEDDFARVERNFMVNLGVLAQAEGPSAIYSDLRSRFYADPKMLAQEFAKSPVWLKELMVAWADGLNFYLATHPQVSPKVIRHFEPWMALAFTEGSIGGDIESIDLKDLEAFYGKTDSQMPKPKDPLPGGSNGFAIGPTNSASGHALLLINPHTTHYFRAEAQMVSKTGLNVYGAITWGQFFVYQGFNEHNGWMHTSDGGDAIDEFVETIVKTDAGLFYKYGKDLRKVEAREILIPYRDGDQMNYAKFTAYFTHHGPIIRANGDKWVAFKILHSPVKALTQSFLRTKTKNYDGFYKTQDLLTDTSNNTVYADADGTIAYFHGNFVPRRNPKFDFTKPVDGSDPATDWLGTHKVAETILLKNPSNGWIQNTNNWPFSAAGSQSPKQSDYVRYMWTAGENARGLHAVQLLEGRSGLTLDSLIAAAYDSKLTGFDQLLPGLFAAYDALGPNDPRRAALADQIALLRNWDRRSSIESKPTSLAVFWGRYLLDHKKAAAKAQDRPAFDVALAESSNDERLDALTNASARMVADFGTWSIAWGEINRFQRISDDVAQKFDDTKPSLPVGFASAQWGSLAALETQTPAPAKKLYGMRGNSFVAAIEFGPKLKAKAIMAGGQNGDPKSPHFQDQAEMYASGKFRDVLFYPEDVKANLERQYHPGG